MLLGIRWSKNNQALYIWQRHRIVDPNLKNNIIISTNQLLILYKVIHKAHLTQNKIK